MTMKDINYKEKDRQAILAYLKGQEGSVPVARVLSDSGADRLRVYTLLFELEQSGQVEVVKSSEWGSPEMVKIKRNA